MLGFHFLLFCNLSIIIQTNQSPSREKKAQVLGHLRPLWPCFGEASFTEWYHSSCYRGENQKLRRPITCPRFHKDYKKVLGMAF